MMIDFDVLCEVSRKKVQLLINNIDAFAWSEWGGEGWWDPHDFEDLDDRKKDALALTAVKVVVPYGGQEHKFLSKAIAKQIGRKYSTYPWVIQTVAYVIASASYSDLEQLIDSSNLFRARMKEKDLIEINSMEDINHEKKSS